MKKPQEILTDFLNKLETVEDPKEKVRSIVDFVVIYGDSHRTQVEEIVKLGVSISREIAYREGEIICYLNLIFFEAMTSGTGVTEAQIDIQHIYELLEELKTDLDYYSLGLNQLAYFFWFKGEYEKGFNAIFETFSFSKQSKSIALAWNHFGLAVFYFDTKDLDNACINFQLAYEVFKEFNHSYGMARASGGLASIYIVKNDIDQALPYLKFSSDVYKELSQHSGLSRALNDMGMLERSKGNYQMAIDYLTESIEIRKEISHKQGLITSYTELGETYFLTHEIDKALFNLNEALKLAIEINTYQKQMRLYKLKYDIYKQLNDTEAALYNFEKYYELKTKLLSDEASNNIKKIQNKFEKETAEKEAEIERLKNIELKKAYDLIEQKNKDITDSINYAKRIQLGILPTDEVLRKCFKNYFVLYKPKDIVSGDFYWAVNSVNRKTKDNISIIAAVDCTGHGVPGAFMSMLGNTLLNQTIVNPDIVSSADVLNYLNVKLPENLSSQGLETNIRDGMDMALCIFNFKTMKLQFSGANHSCWIVRNEELIEIKGDKQAISASNDLHKKDFFCHHFDLLKGDMIYLFTDGFPDQFGGPKGKKFGSRQLKEAMLLNYQKSMSKQKSAFHTIFESWKKEHEQIDDVCLIGIRV